MSGKLINHCKPGACAVSSSTVDHPYIDVTAIVFTGQKDTLGHTGSDFRWEKGTCKIVKSATENFLSEVRET